MMETGATDPLCSQLSGQVEIASFGEGLWRIGAEAASDLSILFHPIISLASVLWTGVLSNLLLPLWEATLKWHSSTAPAARWQELTTQSAAAISRAVARVTPVAAAAGDHRLIAPLLKYILKWKCVIDEAFASQSPALVALLGFSIGWIASSSAWRLARRYAGVLRGRTHLQVFFDFAKSLPGVSHIVAWEHAKVMRSVRSAIVRDEATSVLSLPLEGCSKEEVLRRMGSREARDVRMEGKNGRVSGAVYAQGQNCLDLMTKAYQLFMLTNPLHADVFPSVRQMEAEVIAMTASFLGGGPDGACPTVCGAMTGGGTESILSAMKASRDFMAAKRGVTEPEMVVAESAHPAYFKAASYFKIKAVVVRVDRETLRLRASDVARAVTRNTVVVVASAPGYPHGVMDDVEGIAEVARRRGVCCHVDACLGGFVLPFARRAGFDVPPMDFTLRGVTSMSVDTHKFGMAHKGTSVVLYRDASLRAHQFTAVTDWSGGLYISPGFAGSKSGALIATAWAAMLYHGSKGYEAVARELMETREVFVRGLKAVPELEIMGDPCMSLVAFRSRDNKVDIYQLLDLLSKRGWHLNALHRPPALHMCFTARSANSAEPLLNDIREAVRDLKGQKEAPKGGMAPVYGVAGSLPDRGAVADILVAYQSAMLDP